MAGKSFSHLVYAKSEPPYPRFYRYLGRRGSDKKGIMSRMQYIPEKLKHEVAREYERLYLSDKKTGREKANTYLKDLVKQYTE